MSDDQEARPIFVPATGAAGSRGADEIHSFVLRVHRQIEPSGRQARLQFHLEDVGAGLSWRLTEFNSIVERLRERVSAIQATAQG